MKPITKAKAANFKLIAHSYSIMAVIFSVLIFDSINREMKCVIPEGGTPNKLADHTCGKYRILWSQYIIGTF
ncbi:MAG: hypothetical protein WKF35_05020 [Ferruginibacter sp.]